MLITPLERRTLVRRLKNRIPRAWRAGIVCPQRLVLVVMTNVWLAPGTLAHAKTLNTDLVLLEESVSSSEANVFTRSYTKEELQARAPDNPTVSLGEVLKTQVTSFVQAMGAQKGMSKLVEFYNAAPAPSKSDFALYAAAMRDDRLAQRNPDGEQVKSQLSSEFQGAASDKAIKSNDILTKLKTGMNFNLDLGTLFSKKQKPKTGSVRYGLILQDVNPDPNAPPRAAIGESVEEQMKYAGQAEVVWTIGPVSEENGRPFSGAAIAATGVEESPSFWSRLKVPSGKFKGKIEGANGDQLKPGLQAAIPGIKYTMSQEQGLYELTYQTKANFEKEKMEHLFKVPVGDMALGRRYSDNFEVIQTSAFNVLIDKRAPIVNIHYMNLEDRYAADLKFAKNKHEIGANIDLPSGWKTNDKLGKNPAEKYKVEYKLIF